MVNPHQSSYHLISSWWAIQYPEWSSKSWRKVPSHNTLKLVGGWALAALPLWKVWTSVGMILPNIWKTNMLQTTNQKVYSSIIFMKIRVSSSSPGYLEGLSSSRPRAMCTSRRGRSDSALRHWPQASQPLAAAWRPRLGAFGQTKMWVIYYRFIGIKSSSMG